MLFPIPNVQTEPMRWTGDVRAFAYYATPECLPEERLATVYLARKLFEDGSTVTTVRSVPNDRHPTLRAATTGEGWIERDASGTVVSLDAYTDERPHGGSYSASGASVGRSGSGTWRVAVRRAAQPYPVTLNRLSLRLDPKTGMLAGAWDSRGSSSRLEFAQPRLYWLDPLEAIAFGSPASMAAGWLLPSGIASFVENRSRVVGVMFAPTMKGAFAFEINGSREAFRRVDLAAVFPGAKKGFGASPAGTLLFRSDGRLAGYIPKSPVLDAPSTLWTDGYSTRMDKREVAPPPVASKGKFREMWDRGLDPRLNDMQGSSIFVVVPVTAQERAASLASIPERQSPTKPEEIDKTPPADG